MTDLISPFMFCGKSNAFLRFLQIPRGFTCSCSPLSWAGYTEFHPMNPKLLSLSFTKMYSCEPSMRVGESREINIKQHKQLKLLIFHVCLQRSPLDTSNLGTSLPQCHWPLPILFIPGTQIIKLSFFLSFSFIPFPSSSFDCLLLIYTHRVPHFQPQWLTKVFFHITAVPSQRRILDTAAKIIMILKPLQICSGGLWKFTEKWLQS